MGYVSLDTGRGFDVMRGYRTIWNNVSAVDSVRLFRRRDGDRRNRCTSMKLTDGRQFVVLELAFDVMGGEIEYLTPALCWLKHPGWNGYTATYFVYQNGRDL
ncbi:hypothetical protein KCP78_19055 [Salmonella enterica subsp. enterica]|nr:hypothetical protein KCP78_19055 [Salmonella enterica subsp. enterica]